MELLEESDMNVHYRHTRGEEGLIEGTERLERARRRIVDDLEDVVETADAAGVVVPMDGAVESSLVAALAADAVGADRVLGLALPAHKIDHADVVRTRTFADELGIEFLEIPMYPLIDAFKRTVVPWLDDEGEAVPRSDRRTEENAVERLRMACLYFAANRRGLLVCGPTTRSELLLGTPTKHGDGAADHYPLGDLYSTEVRALATHRGLPEALFEPGAGAVDSLPDRVDWAGTDRELDSLLFRVLDREEPIVSSADTLGVDRREARLLLDRHVATRHKRRPASSPGVDERDRSS